MTKGELRRARKAARANGQPLVGDLEVNQDKDDRQPTEFTDSHRGYQARERWARRYNDLNGAPEGEWDR